MGGAIPQPMVGSNLTPFSLRPCPGFSLAPSQPSVGAVTDGLVEDGEFRILASMHQKNGEDSDVFTRSEEVEVKLRPFHQCHAFPRPLAFPLGLGIRHVTGRSAYAWFLCRR